MASALLDALLSAWRRQPAAADALALPEAAAIVEAPPPTRAEIVVEATALLGEAQPLLVRVVRWLRSGSIDHATRARLRALVVRLLRARLPFTAEQLARLARALSENVQALPPGGPIKAIEHHVAAEGVSPELRRALDALRRQAELLGGSERRRLAARLAALVGEVDATPVQIERGGFGDALLAWLAQLSAEQRERWEALLGHAATSAGRSRPSHRWTTRAGALLDGVERQVFARQIAGWLERVELRRRPEDEAIGDNNQDLLKGLIWAAAALADQRLASTLGAFAERCFRKIKDVGPASTRLGNACLFALGAMPDDAGVAQLSRLASKVRYASARGQVERALQQAAERGGHSREEIEELAVPDFGLDGAGRREVRLGQAAAEITVERGGQVALRWIKPGGGRQKSAPKAVRAAHADELAQLRKDVKALGGVIAGQAARLQRLYLQRRRMPLATLRSRYLEHPVVGQLARRLLWLADDGARAVELWWQDGRLLTLGGAEVEPPADAEARLWHVLDVDDLERLLVWRDQLEERGVSQPFPQLWREVYRPRDPDVHGDDRFVGQIVRQHPLRSLCQQRGWQYALQGYWDSLNRPTLSLERWGLTATLAADPLEHRSDEQYVFNYLRVGEVRWHRAAAGGVVERRALPLSEVPPLVFSEVMRDVDLFVGASTVATDPAFDAEGIAPRWRREWRAAAWGELTPVGVTRREVLARLLPRTTLRAHATLDGRYLRVAGADGAQHRIHLGSANVRGDGQDPVPVVPARAHRRRAAQVFLPFEGDSVLRVILAKAFALAGDPGA